MADTKISALTAATTPLAGTEVLPIVQSGSTKKVAVSDLTAGRSVSASTITASSTSAVAGVFNRSTSGTDAISFAGTSGMTGYLGSISTVVWIGRGAGGTANLISFDASASNIYSPDQSKYIEVKNTGTSITGTLSTSDNLIQGTAAKGINFTANTGAAGMTSQLLNWYEEGTFTPAITTSNADATVSSYTSQKGFYTRIGSQVFCSIQLRANLSAAGTGNPRITGLPYSALADTNGSPAIIYWDLFATKGGYTSYCPNGIFAGGGSVVDFPGFTWATGVNNYLYFTVTYRT